MALMPEICFPWLCGGCFILTIRHCISSGRHTALPWMKCHDNDGDEAVDVDERSFSYPGPLVQSFCSCNFGWNSEWEQELDVIKVCKGVKISSWSWSVPGDRRKFQKRFIKAGTNTIWVPEKFLLNLIPYHLHGLPDWREEDDKLITQLTNQGKVASMTRFDKDISRIERGRSIGQYAQLTVNVLELTKIN